MKKKLELIQQYLENKISQEDRETLKQWVKENEEHKNIFKNEIHKWSIAKEEIPVDSDKAYYSFTTAIKKINNTKVRTLHSYKKVLSYAAILVGVLVTTYYIDKSILDPLQKNTKVVNTQPFQEDKIKIVQEDGTVTYLDTYKQSDIVTVNGTIIGTKEQNEFIVATGKSDTTLEYLEISIPKGKIFTLRLQDGTHVWLNSASKLKFPKQFTASEKNRIVYLEGEAFFDVTTNKKQPFIVKTATIDVEVLGTQFNVSSYAEDTTVQTTLVEGSVALHNTNDITKLTTLEPNDQVVYTKQNKLLDQKKVNTKIYTSWMYRKMIIQDESFASLIKRLERTYDVDIISTNKTLNTTRFTGEFDLENVRQILNIFSETIDFTYTIENKQIFIAP